LKKIGVIGPNKFMCTEDMYDFGIKLGLELGSQKAIVVCGGMGGFMEAVCSGVKQSQDTFDGQTVGILPSGNADDANAHIDLAIPTGVGIARNLIIVNTCDIIIAVGGGAGTLSELAFAWQQKKVVLCVSLFDGWAKELAGKDLDLRATGLLIEVGSIPEILECLKNE
jgi:uncharacterized protein (TIGR00725 family)